MHYVDVGHGPPLVMVHGTPTWSFLYRHLIRALSLHYRCIVPDHLGFGLSDKPVGGAYAPYDHARRLQALIARLELRDVVLVVHDFGGPIGLSYAIEHPDNVQGLVLFNTWMWSMRGDAAIESSIKLFGGSLGKFLYLRLNISPRLLIRAMMGDASKLTRAIHQHYINPFPRPEDRVALWAMVQALLGASDWYDQLWQQRQRIAHLPALILWGMQDPVFQEQALNQWTTLLTNAQTQRYPQAGHFVQEEEGQKLGPVIFDFLHTMGMG